MPEKTRDLELRRNFKLQLIQNPNYFGNLTDLKLPGIPKPVVKKIGDTTYEELKCLGYNPDTDILTAIVVIKRASGYLGDSCTDGSDEFVRFYLDYGDGVWIDHGVAGFDAHDLGFKEDLCYAVSIRLDPKRRSCCDRKPVLPNVRAILSWNTMPPANMPNWQPVWGNRLERHVQIEPRNSILCKLLPDLDIGVQQIDPAIVAKIKEIVATAPPLPNPPADLPDLVKKGADQEMGVLRAVFPVMAQVSPGSDGIETFAAFKALDIDLSPFDDFIAKPAFNTFYEELHCVGLDRDRFVLHGVVQVKRSSGYSGDLCSQGSREYIAFYLDFGSGWEYMGTTFVTVHDVDVPRGGLWFQAALPIKKKLDPHRQEWCKAGKARIRGILSWAVPPAPNQPNFVPHWGDREDCWIEVQPLPEDVRPGQFTVVLESIGNMSVGKIDGAGYATGSAVGNIYTANNAPFGGKTLLKGSGFNVPPGLQYYRIFLRRVADGVVWTHTEPFDADVTTFPGIIPVSQTITPVGEWYPFIDGQSNKSVAEDLLGVLKGLQDGLHEVWLDFHSSPGGSHLFSTPPRAFMVDNTAPQNVDIEITSGTGNCGKFNVGDKISGTYSMSDPHPWYLRIHVTPPAEAAPGVMTITPDAAAPVTTVVSGGGSSAQLNYPVTLAPNGSFGTWELNTAGMPPCGYNVWIRTEDRTITNSGSIGWPASDVEGFCLE